MADIKDAPPAYQASPPQSQPVYGYDQGYRPSYASASNVVQSTGSVVVVNQPMSNVVCMVQPRPPDYLGIAILSCLCCFWPLGLVAIILAIEARSLADIGLYEDAKKMSNITLGLTIASILIGIAAIITLVVIYTTNLRRY